jgi:hypothetical protein
MFYSVGCYQRKIERIHVSVMLRCVDIVNRLFKAVRVFGMSAVIYRPMRRNMAQVSHFWNVFPFM